MPKSILNHPFLEKATLSALALSVLVFCFWVTRPVERSAWEIVRSGHMRMDTEAFEVPLGQGLVFGVFGGFRSILADFAWIRLYIVWERRNGAKLDALIRLVTTLDPRSEYFWINASRMLAYDVPVWRISEEGDGFPLPAIRQEAIHREQSEQAFRLLRRALEFHPDSPKVHLEIGQIYLNCLKEEAEAAAWFLKATKLPEVPHFVPRVYAELLRRQGRLEEAYAYLKRYFSELEAAPAHVRQIVIDRIFHYETLLGVPPESRIRPDSSEVNGIEWRPPTDSFPDSKA